MTGTQTTHHPNWTGLGIVAGGIFGIFAVVALAFLYIGAPSDRVENFGLDALVDGTESDETHLLTPLEEARAAFREQYRLEYKSRTNPEITGTRLLLRAISELNARERQIKIDDAVRLLRDYPEAKPTVYALVDTYLENNPHMATRGATVKAIVEARLKHKPKRRLEWLDY